MLLPCRASIPNDHGESPPWNMKQRCAMTVALTPPSLTPLPFSLREKLGMREGAPARDFPAGIGGKAAQSGEKDDKETLRVVSH